MHPEIRHICQQLCSHPGIDWKRLSRKRVLLTGSGGFLGYNFMHVLAWLNDTVLSREECHVVGLDNFVRGIPEWIGTFATRPDFSIVRNSVLTPTAEILRAGGSMDAGVDFVIHAASIASPTYYRLHPIETMDANVQGIRNILDFAVEQQTVACPVESILYFSSSEIYGDPDKSNIPTKESYWGNVSCTGPRACYDESKRYGETLCVNFQRVYGVPVKLVRPFNNYGPGLKITDRRVIPDFARNILNHKDILLLSDGSPTRTFCYVADALTGYWQLLFSQHDGEPFNIGVDAPEISMRALAELMLLIAEYELGITGLKVICQPSKDPDYLVDNPNRRCPDITKARELLNYAPCVSLEEGLRRTLRWYQDNATAEEA